MKRRRSRKGPLLQAAVISLAAVAAAGAVVRARRRMIGEAPSGGQAGQGDGVLAAVGADTAPRTDAPTAPDRISRKITSASR